jgi:hypothetical protein
MTGPIAREDIMPEFTPDKWLNFAIDHYHEIESLNEIYDMAKKKVPDMVNLEIVDSINALKSSYFAKEDLESEVEESNVIFWFSPQVYNFKNGKGAFFSFEPIQNWNELVPGIPMTDSPWIVVYYIPSGRNKADRNQDLDKWIAEFKKNKAGLEKKQIAVEPYSDDTQYLAAYYLNKEVNFEVLKTKGELRKGVQKAIQDFTSAILPIMKKMAEKQRS